MADIKISPIDPYKKQAFQAECVAYATYMIFASLCKEEGYEEAAMRLEILASNEKEHAEQWMKELNLIPSNGREAMQKVVEMEHHDAAVMYADLKRQAEVTGDSRALELSTHLIGAEARHEAVIGALLKYYETGDKTDLPGMWVCTHCGNFFLKEEDIPEKCPVCDHDRSDYVYIG